MNTIRSRPVAAKPTSVNGLAVVSEAGQQGSARLDYIDGLRGLAIGMVLLFHAWVFSGLPISTWWNPIASGYIGVDLFLLLSGFCLYWPFVKGSAYKQPTLFGFLSRRARRLLPPYYVAMTLFTLMALTIQSYPEKPPTSRLVVHTFLWHLFLLHNLRPGHVTQLAGPFWSLALEADLYIAMPILVVVARRFGICKAVGLAATVSLLFRASLNLYVGGSILYTAPADNSPYELLANSVLGRWIEFALGMWAAEIVARGAGERSRLPFGLFSIAFLSCGLWVSHRAGQVDVLRFAIYGLGFFFLILEGSRTDTASMSVISAALRNRLLVGLGLISYSVYLIHQPLMLLAVQAIRPHISGVYTLLPICLCILLPLTIGLSRLFHLMFERPFMNSPRH